MVTVKLKGVFKTTAKGKTYYYAWRGGPRLLGEPESLEFLRSYEEARAPLHGLDKRKLRAWIALFKASSEFKGFADSTKRQWMPWLDRIADHFGDLSIRLFDRPTIRLDIRKWREKWVATPRTADYGKQVLSRLLTFIVEEGGLRSNPCEGIVNLYKADRSEIIWTAEDIEGLCKVASKEVAWACRLAALTGLRQGDLLRLSWSHIGVNAVEMRTGKSRGKRTAVIPLTSGLHTLLGEIPKRATTVLTNSDGKPWRSGFSASWNKTVKRAEGLGDRDLHFHDLRGTAATNFYRADLSIREIAAIMAWSEGKVERLIDRYVKRDELLRDRIRRLERFQNENSKTADKTGTAK
jgi:integrase